MTRARAPKIPDVPAILRASIEPARDLPDPVTFATHPAFLGEAATPLYPRQQTILRLIYGDREHMTSYDLDVIEAWRTGFDLGPDRIGVPSDIWQRLDWLEAHGRRHFAQVLFVAGRRAGKGHIGAIMLAYEWYRLLLLDDPQAYYGLAPGKHLRAPITATTYVQARDNLFADVLFVVQNAPCFERHLITHTSRYLTLATPADIRRAEARGGGKAVLRQMASLRAHAISASGAARRTPSWRSTSSPGMRKRHRAARPSRSTVP